MELKLFYRTQRELATALNKLVDAYWQEEIKEPELINSILKMYENNPDKLMKDNQFTTIVQQQCGKRRLAVVGKVLEKK
ncbi:TIGR04540 family protein [Sporolactobacillus sp. THM7-7]|uniref:TIGR04540 family protein n=1 Tax=Heyndrickxia coagulans TaxID=1398 RepID=UPI001021D567|nr:TIGR04540 family protein [Heyndrickxia coagulans]MED4406942.1 TIGR04540 family protein [Heyndrickxia coagulans]RYM01469.1 TIGR04540 family protein [Sporolactobacillus sp. THM7-7]